MLKKPTKHTIPYKTLLSLFFLIYLNGQSVFAGNYPFPQNFTYPYGIKATNSNSATIQSKYDAWKAAMVTSNGCPAGMLRVQRINDGNDTVSEGISYGMLIAVYMDDQATFDGLWKYKEYYNDANGLMNWQIASGGGVAGANSAADADEDITTALIMADKQWGSGGTFNYLALSQAEIQKMKDHLIAGDGSLKPGDSWDAQEFPAYYMPAWYRLYKQVAGSAATWDTVLSMCNSHMSTARNDSNGLVPRNINNDGTRGGNNYDYDSCRVPWRYANDFVWNGDVFAQGQCSRMASFFSPQGAGNIGDDYAVDTGNKNSNNHNAAFTGPAGCSLMVGPASTYQTSLNNFYSTVEGMNPATTYYAGCIQMITLLLMSGNMPDFRNMFTPTNTPTINLSWTKTKTPTITATWTASPIPPPTQKLNFEVMNSSGNGSCLEQSLKWKIKITNWEHSAVPLNNITVRVWVDTAKSVLAEKYDIRIKNAGGTDVSTNITVGSAETSTGATCSLGGGSANKYLTVTFTSPDSLPADGGYLMMDGVVRTSDYSNLDTECNDYSRVLSAWTDYVNNSHFTLYQGADLVCEYTSFLDQDISTGINPCTGGNGCSPAVSPSNTPTKTRSATPSVSPANTFTNTPTRTPASSYTYTRTATGTVTASMSPSVTYTGTRTATASVSPSVTYTGTRTATASVSPSVTYTGTRTATASVSPSVTYTGTRTATASVSPSVTYTGTRTNTPVVPSATYTRTATPQSSSTNTPSATATVTRTNTPTHTVTLMPSGTPTSTRTNTPLATATYTSTPMPTFTVTNTSTMLPSPSNSPTATSTGTPSFTRTVTATHTATATPTATRTATGTATETATKTATRTPSFTRTATPTATMTATRTNTRTATPTGTQTPTGTISPTHSVSPTITETVTGTPPTDTVTPTITRTHTNTPTFTITETNTKTVTETVTETDTDTVTETVTETDTATQTYTVTRADTATHTPTQTGTQTITPVDTTQETATETPLIPFTATITRTIIPSATNTVNIPASATNTPVIPPSATNTPVIIPSATVTGTATPVNTATPTFTLTLTATRSATASVSPSITFTRTPTTIPATQTFTPTLTPTIQTGMQAIANMVPFPNPFNPAASAYLFIDFTATRNDSDSIRMNIYTPAMRLIRKVEFKGADARNILLASRFRCDSSQLLDLANGAYYYVITAAKAGVTASSKVGKLVILK